MPDEQQPTLRPGEQLRRVLQNGPVAVPGVFNALTARMAERAGFPAVYQSGAALSAGLAAVPDIGLLSVTEFAAQGGYLAQAVNIPVLSDADTGFGNPLSVERTVALFESAGLAGLHLEDQQMPKRCGHESGKTLVPLEEMQAKIRAAVSARRDAGFVVIARTDARGVSGLDDALQRAEAYVAAGADAIFPEALTTCEEFAAFAERIDVPLMANMTEFGQSPLLSVEELGEMGYAAVLFPVTLFRIAMKSVENALPELLSQGTQQNLLQSMQTRAELYDLLGFDDALKRAARYAEGRELRAED